MWPDDWPLLDAAEEALRPALDHVHDDLFVLGLCGAQGSGKSTLAAVLARRLEDRGVASAILSLDDLYLARAERERLARNIHPLLRTRGVPGTHDVTLGLAVLNTLEQGRATALPRFDKARDDRAPHAKWPVAREGTRLLILEGWCVGARPEPAEALRNPVNDLERTRDPDGTWRRYVNDALAGDYQRLFGRIDVLMLLAAPSWDVVRSWRVQQEQALRAANPGMGMSDEEIGRFVQHYERLTRYILSEMPGRADLVVELDERRSLCSMRRPGTEAG